MFLRNIKALVCVAKGTLRAKHYNFVYCILRNLSHQDINNIPKVQQRILYQLSATLITKIISFIRLRIGYTLCLYISQCNNNNDINNSNFNNNNNNNANNINAVIIRTAIMILKLNSLHKDSDSKSNNNDNKTTPLYSVIVGILYIQERNPPGIHFSARNRFKKLEIGRKGSIFPH